jgi:hypothetical protein
VCHRTVSGAPGRTTLNCSASGIWGATPLKFTGLSGVAPDCPVYHAEQRLTAPTIVCKSEQCVNSARTARVESEQVPEGAPDSEQCCPVHHRTVRWPHLSELQRSNPNGWVTWLAHRIVSGGAPNCPVRPSTAAFPNGHFGGWGYKYPPNHHTSRHPSFQPTHSIKELVHSIQDTNRLNQNLSKSHFHSKQLVTRRESFAVFF